MNNKLKRGILIFFLMCLISCDEKSQESEFQLENNSDIASYPNGQLTIDELNQYIKNKSIQIQIASDDILATYTDIIQKAVVEEQLLYEAELAGILESTIYKTKTRDLKKKLYTRQYLKMNNLDVSFTNDELKAYYEENKEQYNLPEIRSVYHIFVSNSSKQPKQQINQLKERLINGENFKVLAEKYSDSETRHKQGFIGKLKKGDFSKEFDEIIFQLSLNEPSQVIKTKDGFHLFMVSDKLNEKQYKLNEIKNVVVNDYRIAMYSKMIKETALGLDSISFLVDTLTEENFNDLIQSKKIDSILFEIGDNKLLMNEFYFFVQELSKSNPVINYKSMLFNVYEEMAYSEIIYQYMLDQNITFNQPQHLNAMTNKLILDEFSEIKLKSYLNKNPNLITEFYNENKLRYVTPIKLNIEILTVPVAQGVNLMPELEASIAQLNQGDLTLSNLAEKYTGQVITSGLLNKKQLSEINSNIKRFLSDLNLNQFSPPFVANGQYTIIKLIEKTDPIMNPLPIVREAVVKDYIDNYKTQIFKNITQDYIKSININDGALKNYIKDLKL